MADTADGFGSDGARWETSNPAVRITGLLNVRTRNVSGALNTACMHLLSRTTNPQDAYVAFIDDDDEWERDYLAHSLECATQNDADLVVSGLIRHEYTGDPGRPQKIPHNLSSSSFLVTNPHIQGSNLFVRLGTLLRAGGFDENLESTTDRDVCIRLFDLGNLKVANLNEFMVHHWADSSPRLSSPGSSRKRAGLAGFFRKYSPRMNTSEREQFLKRAQEKFGCKSEDFEMRPLEERRVSLPTAGQLLRIDLVVGLTAGNMESTTALLGDLAKIFSEFDGEKHLVVCNNSGNALLLEKALKTLDSDVEVTLVAEERIHQDASNGKFGSFFIQNDRQSGIGFGRTALHHYLYLRCVGLKNPVVWVLDDDVRVDNMLWGAAKGPLGLPDFKHLLCWMKSQGYSIVIGKILGDAPLPAGSTLRVQLLDFLFNLQALVSDFSRDAWRQRKLHNAFLMEAFPDYYYDLSIRHSSHLEVPFWYPEACGPSDKEEILGKMLRDFPLINRGISVFRPVAFTNQIETSENGIPMRGGNTLIFDTECLRTFPNVAPRIGAIDSRRADTLWSILNRRVGGGKVGHQREKVVSAPLQVRHDKRYSPNGLDAKKILADIYGSATVRSIDEFLDGKKNLRGKLSETDFLRFTPTEAEDAQARYETLVKHRLNILRMNSWRIGGLVDAIRSLVIQIIDLGDSSSALVGQQVESIFETLDIIQETFSPERVSELTAWLDSDSGSEFVDFLQNLQGFCSSFRRELPVITTEADVEDARRFLQSELGLESISLVGHGNEGSVFSDGERAYKHFHYGSHHFDSSQLGFLENILKPERQWRHVTPIDKLLIRGQRVVFATELVDGSEYTGGHLDQLLDLLRECRQKEIVLQNLSPKNLLIEERKLKFVDLGADVLPFRSDLFRQMCKRAYLSYRWSFRGDLRQLMTKSLSNESLPELFGFEYFLTALEEKNPHERLDSTILDIVAHSKARSVLDYGCGKGTAALKLANLGKKVVAYDPDRNAFASVKGRDRQVQFVDREGLRPYLENRETFDCIICNLVLCTIPDDAEAERVLEDCRSLVAKDGYCIIGVCNPFNISTTESEGHIKQLKGNEHYRDKFLYSKRNKKTGTERLEVHRPFSWYETVIRRTGFSVTDIIEIPSIDVPRLCPGSDFLLLKLAPVPVYDSKVSLLIKMSAMEWRTARVQIEHLVKQLENPRRFLEKVVVTDAYEGPFVRQYDSGNWERLRGELETLVLKGVIDRFIVAPDDVKSIQEIGLRWFGVSTSTRKCANGQPTLTTLYGFEQCKGEFIFQVDGDILIGREDPTHDFLGEMLEIFGKYPNALSVGLAASGGRLRAFTNDGKSGKWRTNVRCCLLSKKRLEQLKPLPNGLNYLGALQLPWHRSVDSALKVSAWQNYRGGDPKTFYTHVPNEQKNDRNSWFSAMKALEKGRTNQARRGNDELVEFSDWIGRRSENLVFIVRGRNLPSSKIRRCFESLARQKDQDFGIVAIDAASENEMAEFLENVVCRKLHERLTMYRNLEAAPSSENIYVAITKLCSNPSSVIVELDADDALIGTEVVGLLKRHYAEGVDVTVGSMLRTDKLAEYPVNFENPRRTRGGNVWQHLRSFRKYLFDKIDPDDLKIDGEWIPHNVDWAYIIPIVEMAQHPFHVKTPLYFYEPTGKSSVSKEARNNVIGAIVGKKPYKELEEARRLCPNLRHHSRRSRLGTYE